MTNPLSILSDYILDLMEEKTLTILLAPPGAGKTRLLRTLIDEQGMRVIFFSPLKALALELYENLFHEFPVHMIGSAAEAPLKLKSFLRQEKGMLISTPEVWRSGSLPEGPFERLMVVFDEFHLFTMWGRDVTYDKRKINLKISPFRPLLWEIFLEMSAQKIPLLALTATLEEELMDEIRADFPLAFERVLVLDLGNLQLKNIPHSHLYLNPTWFQFHHFIQHGLALLKWGPEEDTLLFFVKKRTQVDRLVDYFSQQGITALGCKGGEVAEFREQLKLCPRPQVIVATTALSHGVNLPTIRGIYITYPVERLSLWLQMAGRGGRKGEQFFLLSCDKFLGEQLKAKWSWWGYWYSRLQPMVSSQLRKSYALFDGGRPAHSKSIVP